MDVLLLEDVLVLVDDEYTGPTDTLQLEEADVLRLDVTRTLSEQLWLTLVDVTATW